MTTWLIEKLQAYLPEQEGLTAYEKVYKHLFLNLLKHNPRCFWRDDFNPGHVTGSVLVANLDCTKILFMHHPKLNIWLQFGGHCDGEEDVYSVAMRELEEEAGIAAHMVKGNEDIFDLDIQCIPARKNEPEHLHYDVRFLVRYDEYQPIPGSEESITMKWFTLEEAEAIVTQGHGRWRMIQKVRGMQRA